LGRGLHILNAQRHDAQSVAIGEFELTRYMAAVLAVLGENKHEGMALLNAFDDSGGPVLAGRHVARGDPAIDVTAFERLADTIGDGLIFVPIAYEYVSSHTCHPGPKTGANGGP
jgi:hypothetical protein